MLRHFIILTHVYVLLINVALANAMLYNALIADSSFAPVLVSVYSYKQHMLVYKN